MQPIMEMIKRPLRAFRQSANTARYRYGTGRFCPLCRESSRKFMPFGMSKPRPDARCVHCGSLERHRLVWQYFELRTDLFDNRPKAVLHVAPERCLEPLLRRKLGAGYVTADLLRDGVDIKMDITAIDYPDESFDVIYCSHVLEHVPDDRKAMRELRRVLKRDGWAVLLVPLVLEVTDEDPSLTDPRERKQRFGQEDHVRLYGRDYPHRLRECGFDVEITTPADMFSPAQIRRYGLTRGAGEIYACRRGDSERP